MQRGQIGIEPVLGNRQGMGNDGTEDLKLCCLNCIDGRGKAAERAELLSPVQRGLG